jgi:hypothetical protein
MIYVDHKHVTIKGEGDNISITRAPGFAASKDTNRDWFNPSMFEVASDVNGATTASLTLLNITLDDADNPDKATMTNSIPNDGGTLKTGWESRVYDSVISAYSSYSTVTLGDGAKIINVGGATAIRMSPGTLNMDPGSYVEGSNNNTGFYGAIWLQGGTLNFDTTMDGATIDARYIYTDSSATVNFSGKIINCLFSKPLFEGTREKYTLTLTSESEVSNNRLVNTNMFILGGTGNTVEFSGKVNNNRDTGSNDESCNLIQVSGTNLSVNLKGEIKENVLGSSVLLARYNGNNQITLHESSITTKNSVKFGTFRQYESNAHFHVYGEVSNNVSKTDNGGGFYLSKGYATMYPGAKVIGNEAYGSGGGFYLNQGATLTMLGGEISANTANNQYLNHLLIGLSGGGGVCLTASVGSQGSSFIMYDGEITGNNSSTTGGGIFLTGRQSGHTFIMEGGTIINNTAGANTGKDIAVGAGWAPGASSGSKAITSTTLNGYYVSVGPDTVIGSGSLGVALYSSLSYSSKTGVYILDRTDKVRLGNISTNLESAVVAWAKGEPGYSAYTLRSSIWYSTDSASDTSGLVMTYPMSSPNNYEWIVAIQPLDAAGSAIGTASIHVPSRTVQGLFVTVPVDGSADGYAVVVMSVAKNTSMQLDLAHEGDGDFFIGNPSDPKYTVTVSTGGNISDFKIIPASGWIITSAILVAGDGMVVDKTADALSSKLRVSYSELASGTNTITVTFVDTRLYLDLVSQGDGDFYIDVSGTHLITATMALGDPAITDFVITPASGWIIGSVILLAGDGTVVDKAADALSDTLSVAYEELAEGINTITVTFVDTRLYLDLVSQGEGDFYIDVSGTHVITVMMVPGCPDITDFVIAPADRWVMGSVILVTGDGTVIDKTDDALNGPLSVSYSELASGTNIIAVTFTEVPLLLELVSYGEGEFCLDGPLGREYTVTMLSGSPDINGFVIIPAEGWTIGSVILTIGDGTVHDKTDDALNYTLCVSYSELTTGTNVITVTFTLITVEPPPGPDPEEPPQKKGSPWAYLMLIISVLLISLILLAFLWNRHIMIVGTVKCDGEVVKDAMIQYEIVDRDGKRVVRDVPVTTDTEGRYVIFVRRDWDVTIIGTVKEGRSTTGAVWVWKDRDIEMTLPFKVRIKERVTRVNFTVKKL